MSKPASAQEAIEQARTARVVSPDDEIVAPPTNDELQSEIEAQRAFEETTAPPMQPYVLESSAFRNEMLARKAKLDADIGTAEAVRDGMNARIDDMNATRVAVNAALEVLK